MISGSSAAGMLLRPICLTATVSPVCQLSALLASVSLMMASSRWNATHL